MPKSKRKSVWDCTWTESTLKGERGWTPSLIDEYLGEPDYLRANPHYRNGPKLRLYKKDRVEAAEGTAEFQQILATARRLLGEPIATVERTPQELLQWVAGLKITVPELERDELIRRALRAHNHHRENRGGRACPPDFDSDPVFVERICVNFLRHEMTGYDELLRQMAGRMGYSEAHRALRAKVLTTIAVAYPWLTAECYWQKDKDFVGPE